MPRGRPRKVGVEYDALAREEMHKRAVPIAPAPDPDDPNLRLLPLEGPEMDATYFGRISSVYMRRRWIRQGRLRCVRIGRQTFVSEAAIAEFIASGGAR